MKPEALKLMQEAVGHLRTILDGDYCKTFEDAQFYAQEALNSLRAAVFMETPTPSMKFNIYDFTDDDNGTRPALGCVHHEEGYKVATDAHVLIAVKDAYPDDLEGKNIDKKGEEWDGKYPQWKLVFPDRNKKADCFRLDFDKLAGWMKEHATERKMKGKWGVRNAFVKVGPAFFKLELFARFAKFMKAEGTDIIHVEDSRRAASCYAENGSKGLIMPAQPIPNWEKQETAMIWEVA